MAELEKIIVEGIKDGRRAFKGPGVVQLDLTGRCNNACIGCWVHSPYIKNPPRDKNVTLELKKAREVIDSLARLETAEIFLSGAGDPFMHPDILEIIGLIKGKGFKLNIITNLTLLDREKAQRIADLKVDLITASIWAGTPDGYIKTHPGKTKDDFFRIRETLEAIARLKKDSRQQAPRIKIYNVICNQNCDEISQMVDFALSCGVEFVEFQIMDLIDGATGFLALSGSDIAEIKKQFDSLLGHERIFFHEELEKYNLSCADSPELKEFPGRLLMIPEGFSVSEAKNISCPKGATAVFTAASSACDEENNIFYFPFRVDKCASCASPTCPVDEKGQLPVKFLRILGYGSFMRRLHSANVHDNAYENELVNNIPCYIGWTYSRVMSTGEVIPCCKSSDKPLGDINKQPFSDIWNSYAYQEFRNKAKRLPKTNAYFQKINCRKSCDNAGMNLEIHQQISREEKSPGQDRIGAVSAAMPQGRIHLKMPDAAEKVFVNAGKFERGNLNPKYHHFGEGLAIDGGHDHASAEYEAVFRQPGRYELWSRYASEEVRPVEIYLDGELINNNALAGITGGWRTENLKWFLEASLEVTEGKHILKIFAKGIIPHIHSFAFLKGVVGDDGEEIYRAEGILPYPEPLKLLNEKIRKNGVVSAVAKLFNYAGSGSLLRNYLDVLGIYNGEYAFCGPFHAQIDLTYNCNNDCIGCWCNSPLLEEKAISPQTKSETLPFGLLTELLDQLAGLGTKEIYFSGGGEPFTHPRIMDILEYAKKKKFICYVNTNFTLLDKEKIKKIIDLGVEHLTVSTWAATPGTYALTHPNKSEDTFRQIVENLRFLNESKTKTPFIKLYNVIFNLNYHEIKNMVHLAQETHSESTEFTLIDTIPGKTDRLLLDSSHIAELQKDAWEISRLLDKSGHLNGVLLFRFDSFLRRISSSSDLKKATYDRNIIDRLPCYIGWFFVRIMPNGDVNACLKAHRIPTGNLYRASFNQIWNGEKQRYFRRKALVREKKDPFFQLIGNDPQTKEAGCYKSCDDIGRNTHIHNRIMSLTFPERGLLKAAAVLRRKPKIKAGFQGKSGDPILDGIRNGRQAFCGPEQVVIDLTNRCNQKCAGCWLYSPLLRQKPQRDYLAQEISFEKAANLISQLAELGTKRIRFTGGGEPFMHPDIMRLIAHAKSKGLACCITTNLALLNKEKIRDLTRLEVDELAVSLWASNQAAYQRTHPGSAPDTFEKIKDNLQVLAEEKNSGMSVTFCNVICNLNYLEAEDMFRFALEMKADGIYFTLVDTLEGTDSLILDAGQRLAVLRQAGGIRKRWEALPGEPRIKLDYFEGFLSRINQEVSSLGDYDRERINKIPCYAGWFFARVAANGEVAPCCRGMNKPMGNVNRRDFKDIWLSPEYDEFRAKAKYLPKTDHYFEGIGCLKMCDNLMHNEQMHSKVTGR